jgi:hypothetical protein|tara:strand:+ start:485 stop:724 length:240 start_codon:yes stop_codon:yes gene_type:complete
MFVDDKIIAEIAEDLQADFEIGELHSHSNVQQVARFAQQELADRHLPTRKSLAIVIAKVAMTLWQETILATVAANHFNR